jgi:hypothetical protein
MPFAGIWEIHQPFLRGASQHPKVALFQNGWSIFNMGMSYDNISLVHLADHLLYLSSSSSFWFSLNSSYDHDFHLSKRLGMTPKDYEFLLVAADLAHFHKRWGFSIKMSKLRLFLEGHLFTTINCDGTMEVDLKKIDLNAFIQGESAKHREDFIFIRIGVLYASSHRKIEMQKDPHDGRMIVTPPRLNGLRLQQSSFRRLIEPILWNYILDNDSEEGKEVDEPSSDEEDDSVISPTPTEPPYSVAASMVTPGKTATPVDHDHTSNKYPHISQALGDEDGYFDPADPSVIKSMQGLLQEINHLLSTKYELNLRAITSNRPTLMRAVAAYSKRREMVLTNKNEQEELTHRINESMLKDLNVHRNRLAEKIKKARRTLADQQQKLKAIETVKGKTEYSVETKMFKLLKNVGVELSSYHGGSLNGKDIKKVMNNSAHIFDELAFIMKEGKRPNSILSNANVDALCLHFREVFVLWDGAFSLAQTVGPMEQDTKNYLRYVLAAVHGNDALGCTVTPKVHMMLKHVAFQMRYIRGGLGDKMEDWVEQLHQTGMRLRQRFCTVQNPVIWALAREKANSRSSHSDVIAHKNATNAGNKHSFSVVKVDDAISTR